MNELKPEDVMISCDRPQPRRERDEIMAYRVRIYEAVNYRGTDDHEDVTSILLEYRRNLLREKDAEIERLKKGIERLADESDARDIDETYAVAKVRAEIIDEFAERLKVFIVQNLCVVDDSTDAIYKAINQIAKEMKGE